MCVSYGVEGMIGNLVLLLFNGQEMKRKRVKKEGRERERDYHRSVKHETFMASFNFLHFLLYFLFLQFL